MICQTFPKFGEFLGSFRRSFFQDVDMLTCRLVIHRMHPHKHVLEGTFCFHETVNCEGRIGKYHKIEYFHMILLGYVEMSTMRRPTEIEVK